jgi:hypothetical protein
MNRCLRSFLVCSLVLGSGAVFGDKLGVNKSESVKSKAVGEATRKKSDAVKSKVDAATGRVIKDPSDGQSFASPLKNSGALVPDHAGAVKDNSPLVSPKKNPFGPKSGAPVLTAKPDDSRAGVSEPPKGARKAPEASKNESEIAFVKQTVGEPTAFKKALEVGEAVEKLKFGQNSDAVIENFNATTLKGVYATKLADLDSLLTSSRLNANEKAALRASVGLFLADVKRMEKDSAARTNALKELDALLAGFKEDLSNPATASDAAKYIAGALAFYGKDAELTAVHLDAALKKWNKTKADPDARAGLVAQHEAAAKIELRFVSDFFKNQKPNDKTPLDHDAVWRNTERELMQWEVKRLKDSGLSDEEAVKTAQTLSCGLCPERDGTCKGGK